MTEDNHTDHDKTEYQPPAGDETKVSRTKTIGKYDIVSELGRGGMGVVYKAWEDSLQRYVALKMLGDQLTDDETLVERFLREARAVADLNHPNIVQVFAVDMFDNRPYFAMEYVEGESLKQKIHSAPGMKPVQAAELIREAAIGLAAAHAKDVVHRDIKPDNIMITKHGGVKVVDFGIAKVDGGDHTLTATGVMVGTPNYISPEVCLGQKVDARSDIFSLGIVFYEMLAGKTPFQANSPIELMSAVVKADIPDITFVNPEVDNTVKQILSKMLSKDRAHRYQSCEDIVKDLDAYLRGQQTASGATLVMNPPQDQTATLQVARPSGTKSGAPLVWALALLLLAGAATAGWIYVEPGTEGWQGRLAAAVPFVDFGLEPDQQQAGQAALDGPVSPGAGDTTEINAAAYTKDATDGDYLDQQMVDDLIAEDVAVAATGTATDVDLVQLGARTGAVADETSGTVAPGSQSGSTMPAASSGFADSGREVVAVANTSVTVALNTRPDSLMPVEPAKPAITDEPSPAPSAPPAPAGQPQLVVVALGDPAITRVIGSVLENALMSAEYEVLDEALFEQNLGGNLASVGRAVSANGGNILVYADVQQAGQRELKFYDRTEWQTIANLQVQVLALEGKKKIGAPWSAQMEYVPLNAAATAEEVSTPIAAELVERLQAYTDNL